MASRLAAWLQTTLELILPFSCHICRDRTSFGRVLCTHCRKMFEKVLHSPALVKDVNCRCPIFAMGTYAPPVSDIVKTIKYRPSAKLLHQIAELIEKAAASFEAEYRPQILIPIPLHPSREAARGFNQAKILADILAHAWKAEVSQAVIRTRRTKPQAECNEAERATNPIGAFALANGLIAAAFADKKLALIDDVATTGATLDACAAEIERLKPASLIAVTLAHSFKK